MGKRETFEERKERVLREAREAGIVDVSTLSLSEGGESSLETVEFATRLMKEHGEEIYENLENKRQDRRR